MFATRPELPEYPSYAKALPKTEEYTYESGAKRDSAKGKGRFDLIPFEALYRLAMRYEGGAELYGDENWKKGMPRARLFSSAIRHLFKALAGFKDEDHLAASAWNIFALMYFEEIEKSC